MMFCERWLVIDTLESHSTFDKVGAGETSRARQFEFILEASSAFCGLRSCSNQASFISHGHFRRIVRKILVPYYDK